MSYALIILIVSTIWTESYIQPPEFGPMPIGILYQFGIQIKYAFMVSVVSSTVVLLLNRRMVWNPFMFLAILGLAILVVPAILLYLIDIFTLIKQI
ncbi:hypothetical protein [Virgibacillus dokdonensis]|uniref:hypothetical protein n=1 Tax=Virgibacillus dokdonensis TaxID=302167 RepID=UPI00113226F1|nr:hypothetical protein [Virgibacillus dokdonensis]